MFGNILFEGLTSGEKDLYPVLDKHTRSIHRIFGLSRGNVGIPRWQEEEIGFEGNLKKAVYS